MAGKANTIKNTIILEGEKQYKKAMADITAALKESKSAQRAAAAEFKASGEDMQKAAAYSEALAETYRQQGAQLEEMERHLKDVEEAYGKNSREATTLRTRINNTRTEMARTQGEMRDFEARLQNISDGGGDAAQGMAAFTQSAQEARGDVEALSASIADAVGQKTIDFVVGGAALNALKDGLKETVTWAIGEGVDGARERGYLQAGTGDAALTDARLGVKDEIDKRWSGRLDGMQTASAVETVDTVLDNMSLSLPAMVVDVTNAAIFQQERFGASVGEQMERADAMVKAYGISWMEAFDLMTLGFQNSHDGGALMLRMFDENAQTFKQMGYDADDMFSVILNAVNSEELGKDSNLNKGMLALMNTVTGGSKEAKETLTALGLEATDIGVKAQEGGETAAAAYQLILRSLMEVTDEATRNSLGKALFGDNVWTATGGEIASALLSGFGQTIETDGVTQKAMDAMLDNIGDNWAGLKERVGQAAGAITEPLVEGANNAIKALNEGIDNGELLKGVGNAVLAWGDGLHAAIDPAIEKVASDVEEKLGEVSQSVSEGFFGGAEENVDAGAADAAAQRWVDVLRGGVDSAAAESEQSEALNAMLEGMLPDTSALSEGMKTWAQSHKAAVVAQMQEAYGQENDEDFEAWKTFQQSMIDSAYKDTTEQADQLGADTVQAEADAIEENSPKAETAGEGMGEATADGFAATAASTYAAAGSIVDGTVLELRRAIPGSYAAGYAAGSAFESGYRAATDTHSPSRKMQIASQDVLAGVFEPLEKAESDIYARGAALGAALEGGYRGAGGLTAAETGAGGADVSVEALTQALTEALSGLGLYASGEKIGQVGAESASREMNRASMESIAGRSNRIKGW